jgi:hypothetical protein
MGPLFFRGGWVGHLRSIVAAAMQHRFIYICAMATFSNETMRHCNSYHLGRRFFCYNTYGAQLIITIPMALGWGLSYPYIRASHPGFRTSDPFPFPFRFYLHLQSIYDKLSNSFPVHITLTQPFSIWYSYASGVTIKHTLGSYHHISLYVYTLPFPWSNMPHSA